jgi:hypothetical protein
VWCWWAACGRGTVISAGRSTGSLGSLGDVLRASTTIFASCILLSGNSVLAQLDKERVAEKTAVPTMTHPYAGFWKEPGCADRFGLAIAPVDRALYSVSFCGPGGCFTPGTYRPNTKLIGDPHYRLIDNNTIEVRTAVGFSKYVRCGQR